MTSSEVQLSNAASFAIVALLLYTLTAAVMTYPQVLHMREGVHDVADPLLNTWALAWVAHQLPIAPAHLFDANAFFPERRTLAYSEALVVPGVVAAPLHWLGVGPILVYNIILLSGFIVSGVGVALLVRSLTRNTGAALIAGLIFAFLPYRIDHYAHLQLQQTQFIPFALWAFHRLLRTGRARDGVLLGLFVAGQMLSCVYYGVFLIPYMTVVCGAVLLADLTLTKKRMGAFIVAAAVSVAVMAPVGRAYLGARKVVGERNAEEVASGSAKWRHYLAPPQANLLYGRWAERFGEPERRLFPGFIVVALALIALWPPLVAVRVAYGLGLLFAVDLSLGFNGISYRILYDNLLPFHALRIPARMGMMVGFTLAVLAGYGLARVADRIHGTAARRVVLVGLAVFILTEYVSHPIELIAVPPAPPPIYADLARDLGDSPAAVILEFPVSPRDDATYMYYSTFHWQVLMNGYSGFFPPSYIRLVESMKTFPATASIDEIRTRGARYVIIHGEHLFGDRYATLIPELDKQPFLTLVARRPWQDREISLYRTAWVGAETR